MKKILIPLLVLLMGQTGSVKADDTDLTAIDNVIYCAPLEALAGTTTATLSFCMNNTVPIRGFQFDLYLPEGITAATNSKGRILCALSQGRLEEDDEHSLTVAGQDDGSLRFLCGSLYDETFTGNEGEVATLEVNIAADMAEGDYPLLLRNIKLTETDITQSYVTDEVQTTLTILTSVGIGGVTVQQEDTSVFSLSGQRLTAPRKGVNIIGWKKVVVK